ncbi:hypothetical protein GCM10022408_16180 [Hymenobacter fastidiosus]|uniref:Uncharacterized protein n=1 Tax=Hymenobacter fastidiosus TaxID=486264 RepID=A0ABP7S1B6_9BACT
MKNFLLSAAALLLAATSCQKQETAAVPLQAIGIADNSCPCVACDQLRTQTQGGWGTVAKGGNPGTYRDARFASVFPAGLVVGIVGEPNTKYIRFTTSQGIQKFLPQGSTPAPLPFSGEDAQIWDKKISVLVGQQVALKLNIYFDLADPNFAPSAINLAFTRVNGGLFDGERVIDMMTRADRALGGDPNLSFTNIYGATKPFTFSQLNDALSSINENFVDGTTSKGAVLCPTI